MAAELGGEFGGPDSLLLEPVVLLVELLGVFIEPVGRRIEPLCFFHELAGLLLIVLPRLGRLRFCEPVRPIFWICQVSSSDQFDRSIEGTLTGSSELEILSGSGFKPNDGHI